jgi:uncharacterized protein YbjQ (UPF0145 family)
VKGEAVVGANLFRDLFAGIRDIVGGRSGAYEKELRKARDLAFEEITESAQELGANAILGRVCKVALTRLSERARSRSGAGPW